MTFGRIRRELSEWMSFHSRFQVFEFSDVDAEAHQRAYLMETVTSGCSGVNLEHIQDAVVFDFEDMRVSADEQT